MNAQDQPEVGFMASSLRKVAIAQVSSFVRSAAATFMGVNTTTGGTQTNGQKLTSTAFTVPCKLLTLVKISSTRGVIDTAACPP